MKMNKRRINIITFSFTTNYGASLQMFALFQYLKDLGNDVKVIDYRPQAMKERLLGYYRLKRNFSFHLLFSLLFSYKSKYSFTCFNKKYLDFTSECTDVNDILNLSQPDLYITGSDQVWNTDIVKGMDKGYFLNFKTSSRRISYAASIGKDILDKKEVKDLAKMVQSFDSISVREDSLKDMLTSEGIVCELVMDPVFLIDVEKYITMMTKPKYSDYVLVYDMSQTNCINLAVSIAKERNLKVIAIGKMRKREGVDINVSGIGPVDFLSYLYHASYIVTSSFHGTAFSIIFKKNFLVVPHLLNVNTRMISLLRLLNLEDRLYYQTMNIEKFADVNYNAVNSLLEKSIEQSKNYLLRELNLSFVNED